MTAPETMQQDEGKQVAVLAETLFLLNLTVLPFISFFVLIGIYLRKHDKSTDLGNCHLRQTMSGGIWVMIFYLLFFFMVITLGGGLLTPTSLVIWSLYFVVVHVPLLVVGWMGWKRATEEKHYHFPLIGCSICCLHPSGHDSHESE